MKNYQRNYRLFLGQEHPGIHVAICSKAGKDIGVYMVECPHATLRSFKPMEAH
jgi:hypothetical protein